MIELVNNKDLVGKLRRDKAFNVQFLEEMFGIQEQQNAALYRFAKLLYETGSYERASTLVRPRSGSGISPVVPGCAGEGSKAGRPRPPPARPRRWSRTRSCRRTTRGCWRRTGAGSRRPSCRRGPTSSGSTPTRP